MARITRYDSSTYSQLDLQDGAGESGLAEHCGLDIDALWFRVYINKVATTDEFDNTFEHHADHVGRRRVLHFD